MSGQEKKSTEQVLLELLSTAALLVLYWLSMTPEWKLEYYANFLRSRFTRVSDSMPADHRAVLEQFRRELSSWEADQKRDKCSDPGCPNWTANGHYPHKPVAGTTRKRCDKCGGWLGYETWPVPSWCHMDLQEGLKCR